MKVKEMTIKNYFKMFYLKRIKKDFEPPFEIKCPHCKKIHIIKDSPKNLKWSGGIINCCCGNEIEFYNELLII